MLLSKTVKVKWNSRNKKYYIEKGYHFTKLNDVFEVKIEDLMPSSKAKVKVICDFCKNTIVEKTYQTYVKQHHCLYGDCCKNCQPLKNKMCCIDKYGVDNISKMPETIEKIKNTNLQKYGVDNSSKSPQVKEKLSNIAKKNSKETQKKLKETCLQKYGVENVMKLPEVVEKQQKAVYDKYGVKHPKQNDEIKEKEKERNLEKYGVPYVLQLQEIRAKVEETCMKKYGARSALGNEEIRNKIVSTLTSRGKVPTSSQQIALYNLLKEAYCECELNVPCGRNSLDCVIKIDNIKIDVEYDGWYWHKDRQKEDRRRDEYIKSKGYKILRIVSERSLPSMNLIKEEIDYLVKTNHNFAIINLVK